MYTCINNNMNVINFHTAIDIVLLTNNVLIVSLLPFHVLIFQCLDDEGIHHDSSLLSNAYTVRRKLGIYEKSVQT